jgi:pimeloyl-ACP methyl ester carboxylesterase/DNA-binding CsgD family transcriptional regulator
VHSLAGHFEHNGELLAHLSLEHLASQESRLARSLRDKQALLDKCVESLLDAAVVFSNGGSVLATNRTAVRHFRVARGDSIADLGVSKSDFSAFMARCQAASDSQALLLAHAPDQHERSILAGRYLPELNAYLISEVTWSWPPALLDELRRLFSLSEREAAILTDMLSGLAAQQIAERDGRALGTVRQQIKAVLAKLEVSSQAQALALVASTALSWHRLCAHSPSNAHDNFQVLTLTSGQRRIGVRGFGLPGGRPVLLVHGAMFGVGDHAAERAAARQAGLWVLAAEKPGYGRTSPAQGDSVETMVEDMLALLDHAGIERTVVIAHDVGTIAAFRLAYRAPNRVAGIIAAPTSPPMRSWSQTEDMPSSHRIHAWASQRVPRLMNMMITLGVSQIQRQGVSIMPDLFFGGCEFDRRIWAKTQNGDALPSIFRLMAAHNASGFRQDMLLTNLDWSHWSSGLNVPARLFHGGKSRTVSMGAVRHFASSLPRAEAIIVEDGGHTLPITHAELIFGHVAELDRNLALNLP